MRIVEWKCATCNGPTLTFQAGEEWIKISESQPEPCQDVLILCSDGEIVIGYVIPFENSWEGISFARAGPPLKKREDMVIHGNYWMPLPAPPKDKS